MVDHDGDPDGDRLRARMVEHQLRARGIADARVLAAMGQVRREQFVPEHLRAAAYDDGPLPIGEGQTISQPYMVALMAAAAHLRGGEKVLEIGTGSGYAAAVLARLAGEVWSIERRAELLARAARQLAAAGCGNVWLRGGDGTLGLPDEAPFDAIVVAAGGPVVPAALKAQLKIGGRLVIPVGEAGAQELVRVVRTADHEWREERLGGVRFVPLIGVQGWRGEPRP